MIQFPDGLFLRQTYVTIVPSALVGWMGSFLWRVSACLAVFKSPHTQIVTLSQFNCVYDDLKNQPQKEHQHVYIHNSFIHFSIACILLICFGRGERQPNMSSVISEWNVCDDNEQ